MKNKTGNNNQKMNAGQKQSYGEKVKFVKEKLGNKITSEQKALVKVVADCIAKGIYIPSSEYRTFNSLYGTLSQQSFDSSIEQELNNKIPEIGFEQTDIEQEFYEFYKLQDRTTCKKISGIINNINKERFP